MTNNVIRRTRKRIKEIILDMDSSDSPTYGQQEGSAYNGHFGYTCYHPLFVFNQFGDVERALLGNFLRRLVLPKKIRDWSLRTLQVKLIKIGAKVIRHSRYVIFQMAEVMVSRSLFQEILEKIHRLKPVPIGYG